MVAAGDGATAAAVSGDGAPTGDGVTTGDGTESGDGAPPGDGVAATTEGDGAPTCWACEEEGDGVSTSVEDDEGVLTCVAC